jgi:cytoskeletal protein RodZ
MNAPGGARFVGWTLIGAIGVFVVAVLVAVVQPGDLGGSKTTVGSAAPPTTAKPSKSSSSSAPSSSASSSSAPAAPSANSTANSTAPAPTQAPATTPAPQQAAPEGAGGLAGASPTTLATEVEGGAIVRSGPTEAQPDVLSMTGGTSMIVPGLVLVAIALLLRPRHRRVAVSAAGARDVPGGRVPSPARAGLGRA